MKTFSLAKEDLNIDKLIDYAKKMGSNITDGVEGKDLTLCSTNNEKTPEKVLTREERFYARTFYNI
jgi:hypothetical protein